MRNLKKVLALVLAMAMSLSLAVSAGAATAFTDADSIDNAAAVDYCVALGIINGYEDGSFRPDDTISRAEATKLISIAMNGGEAAIADNGKSSFSDVLTSANSKWANKFIEFGVAAGFVAGMGDGTFAPDANVTGSQLSKMLLVACGYNAVEEGYVGSSWELNVNVDAAKAGLYDGLADVVPSEALSRDDAAQMIWNALNAERVGRGVTTLLADKFGAETDEGILTHMDYNQDTGVYTYYLGEMKDAHDKNGAGEPNDEWFYRTTADYTDLFAQKVELLAKGDKALVIRSVYGEDAIVVSDVWGNVSGIDNTHFNTVNISGQKYRLDNVAKDWADIYAESNMVAFNDYDNHFFVGYNHDPITTPGGDDARVSLVYDAMRIHGEFEQYSFVGIDQDGGGDIDIFVVYPYAILKTEAVHADDFIAREIVNRDASMTIEEWEQDRYMIAGMLFDGFNPATFREHSLKASIEFDDIQTVGTIEAYDYVKATPAVFTAKGIDRYEDVAVQSAVANKLSAADLTVTLGDGTFDGSLLEQLDAFRQISLKKTYSFVEENGYLFVVDGNALVPELSQFVVATKVANHTTPNANVDNVFVTEVLTTNGDKMNVEVAATINSWGHHNWHDWFTHAGDFAGISKCPYCDDCGKPVVGSLYYIQPNDEGTYYLAAVPCFSTATNWTSIFDFGQAYIDGATLNDEGRFYGPHWVANHGEDNMVFDTPAGVAFKNYFNSDVFVVEDEAPIFVYNRNLDTYSVVKGSDLDVDNVSGWAFTGATHKSPVITTEKRVTTVDLGYVMVENNPVEETVMAYVDGEAVRSFNEDGKYVISIDVITEDGKMTLTTDASVLQNNWKFQRLYDALEDGGIFELIVDGNTLVDIKDYAPTTEGTVNSIKTVNGVTAIDLEGVGFIYFTADSTYVQIDGPESVTDIVAGDTFEYNVFAAPDDDEFGYIFF
ncbi:MAG: S-layer homology domain-containing protein [Ruminiclostridium sp.]|nr:S-layer homology domain-containing protein [Ruminiclostridium sp.]